MRRINKKKIKKRKNRIVPIAWLNLVVPPRISPFYFETGVTQGMRTQLMCTMSQGDQPFNITWLMDRKAIQMKENGDVTSNQLSASQETNNIQISVFPPFSSILTISNVTAKHSGNYTCRVSNIAGVTEHSASLSVTGLCQICSGEMQKKKQKTKEKKQYAPGHGFLIFNSFSLFF